MRSISLVSGVTVAALVLAGCATARGPRHVEDLLGTMTHAFEDWSRVGELSPGSHVMVTARGSQPATRHFVMADEHGVTLLNLSEPTLPPRIARVLRNMAADNPEYFAAMQGTASFAAGNVRVGRPGVFVADRKIADLEQVLQTMAREDVAEIRGPVVARGSALGTVLGGWLGFAVGVIPGLGGASPIVTWSILAGSVAGGGSLGFRWSSHQTEGVVYRSR